MINDVHKSNSDALNNVFRRVDPVFEKYTIDYEETPRGAVLVATRLDENGKNMFFSPEICYELPVEEKEKLISFWVNAIRDSDVPKTVHEIKSLMEILKSNY